MSTAPDGGWSPGWPGPAASPAANVWWRVRHSWWLLLPILGFSCLGGLGFIYVGVRARRPAWWLSGIGYLIAGWVGFVVAGSTDQESAVSDWFLGVFMASWLAGIVHACLINSAWLRWRAGYRPWWYAAPAGWPGGYPPGPLAPPPGAPGSPVVGPPTFGVPSPANYWGPGPATTPVPPTVAPPGADPARPGVAAAPVDVNAAGAEQLAALPGFDAARVARVLAAREARRGFGSVAEFVAAAGLAPHEYARLRDILVCAPPTGPVTGHPGMPSGRVLDI